MSVAWAYARCGWRVDSGVAAGGAQVGAAVQGLGAGVQVWVYICVPILGGVAVPAMISQSRVAYLTARARHWAAELPKSRRAGPTRR